DPTVPDDPKMVAIRDVVLDQLQRRRPMLAVCLGHQLLAGLLGLRLHRRDAPYQGLARTVELFGEVRRVGFYSTFTALSDTDVVTTAYGLVRLARDRGGANGDGAYGDAAAGDGSAGGDGAGGNGAGGCRDGDGCTRPVHALRGPTFAGLQFHPESVLSEDGFAILREMLTELVPVGGNEASPKS
nr:hypothetical protein [Micromonospora sp. DSM 115978]